VLEDRSLPSTFNAASAADLIADINAANQAGGSNTIVLAANTRFVLTGIDNDTNGANGLPVITANDNLSISGQGGDIVSAKDANGVFYGSYRCFDVAGGAALTLSNLTLDTFQALYEGYGGGIIYNQGSLTLNAATVQNGFTYWGGGAIWSSGSLTLENGTVIQGNKDYGEQGDAVGGGIWSSGALTLSTGTVIQGNSAVGGDGARNTNDPGGNAFGGGLYVAAGTARLIGVTVNNNSARGGAGAFSSPCVLCPGGSYTGMGGDGSGGGLYAAAGATVTLCSDTLESNTASGGRGKQDGKGYGGGLFIAQKATLYLDSFTLAGILNNTADKYANIDGKYALQPC
jgi:hypothetical protein